MNLKRLKLNIEKHAPILLTTVGITGFVTATLMAIKATPAANIALENVQESMYDFEGVSKTEEYYGKAKVVVPIYAPALGVMLMATALVLGASHLSHKRVIAANTLYMASQRYLSRLQDKIVDEVGKKKFEVIKDAASAPQKEPDIVYVAGDSQILCYDVFSDRYFQAASVENIRRSVNDLNDVFRTEMFVSVNDFYDEVGLDHVGYGDDVGWDIESYGKIEIHIGSALTPDNRPCVTITFSAAPKHIFTKFTR